MTDWRVLVNQASDMVGTPCYVISERCIPEAFSRLHALETSVRLRHWLSLKTQPVPRLVQAALGLGLGIDVVSEYELAGAISAGVPGNRILVNGVGKHCWLTRRAIPSLSVHFDSLAEVRGLAGVAKALKWRVGLRCAIPQLPNVEGGEGQSERSWDQFGMTREEVYAATKVLAGAGITVNGLHFHLQTSVPHVSHYRRALEYLADVAQSAGLEPGYVDIGGGMPIAGEAALDGSFAASTFDVAEFRDWLASIQSALPSAGEVWLENGRYLTGASGALATTILDKKVRGDTTYLICDGGRVNHARMASMERHQILLEPNRIGALRKTVVCGPTCTAVDRLGCWMLPQSIEPGDRVIWLTAGAYHIPLETRFSQGLAPVVWFNREREPEIIRKRETPAQWWGNWAAPSRKQVASVG